MYKLDIDLGVSYNVICYNLRADMGVSWAGTVDYSPVFR